MTICWFGRRCYIATGRAAWTIALLTVALGALLSSSSACIILNIKVFVQGSGYIVVGTLKHSSLRGS